jgi:agmatine deiminase
MKIGIIVLLLLLTSCTQYIPTTNQTYIFPHEDSLHEATWLQWPHNYEYEENFQEKNEPIWIAMTKHLTKGERVNIIAYDRAHQEHIENKLISENIPLDNISFFIYPTNDVWIRDNGPIFVYNKNNELVIADWGFNGWGSKARYNLDDPIPKLIGEELGMEVLDINAVVLEGGAVEIDGAGTMMLTRSAVTNANRNPGLYENEIESALRSFYGVTNIIWLDGVAGLEITDMHIDGFLRFLDENTIITLPAEELTEWDVPLEDQEIIENAKNANGQPYNHVTVPLTQNDVVLEDGTDLDYKGSYINYYVANAVVLVPNYNDPNDAIANNIIQELYPNKEIVGIDVRELYVNGGMIHCVTQQQPYLPE